MNTLFQTVSSERSKVPIIFGYALSLACLVWVLRDFHVVRTIHDIANVDWKWVVLAMCCDVLSYGFQALRWKFLLSPFGKVRLTRSVRSVYSGLFANLVFPLRPGEFLRSYLLSNSEKIKLGRVLGSVGVERLIDLVIATASLAIASLFIHEELPRQFKRSVDILGALALIVLIILVGLVLSLEVKFANEPLPDGAPRSFRGRLMGPLTVLHAIGTAPSFYSAVLTSIMIPLCQILALWFVMRSYGLGLSFLDAVVVLFIINLGVSLPNAPANVGSYQFFCVLALSVFQVDKATATGFSIFAFLALTFPFLFLGFAAIFRSGLSLHSMKERVAHLPSEMGTPAA